MTVLIRIDDIEASISNKRWRCDNASLRQLLSTITSNEWVHAGHPHPDRELANIVIRMLGNGKVLRDDGPAGEYVKGRVY